MASSSINRMDHRRGLLISSRVPCLQLLVLVDSDVIVLLRPMEEREGEDRDGGGSWRNTLVFTMTLSQNISFRDKIPLSGKIGKVYALT